MYKQLVRPLLFLLEPEIAHHFATSSMKLACRLPLFKRLAHKILDVETPNSAIEVCGLKFRNRVGLAAGFDKNADYFADFAMLGFSFIEIGTITPLPQPGNPRPRLFRIKEDKAMVNRMGFNNKGVEYAINRLKKRNHDLIVGGNIGKNTLTPNTLAALDYATCFKKMYDYVDYFTLNISCPNIKGMDGLQDTATIEALLTEVMKIRAGMAMKKPVFLKISPDLTKEKLDEIINIYYKSGLDGIVAANTTTKREALSLNRDRVDEIGKGGLSGRPLFQRVKETIVYICKQTSNEIPVIAVGGIIDPENAADLIRAGASLVQVYTGFIYEGPFMVKRINKHLDSILATE